MKKFRAVKEVPTLVTERLLLRAWREEDCLDLYEYAKNPLVGPSAGWLPHKSMEESLTTIRRYNRNRRECDTWAIVLQEEMRAIGSIGLHKRSPLPTKKDEVVRELGYVLNPAYWGHGYMPEAAEKIIAHAFYEDDVDVLWCAHYNFNTNSKRVIEKTGFSYKFGRDEIRYQVDGKRFWSLFYSLKKEDYLEKKKG